ncbi:hypothetical protein ACFQ2D_08345 [Luteimonas composti]|uniref:hypothetical protein n=1 Tax=Luteimonas composti TaxID=398257 RepID=UPI00363D7793
MAVVARTLLCKKVVCVDQARFPALHPLDLHVALKALFSKASTVRDRHYPVVQKVKPGKACVFLEPTKKDGKSVLFHAYIYTAGRTPDQVVQDFDAASATVTADPIKNPDGEIVEIVERVACLVYGECLIIENARVYGALPIILAAIRDLVRRHVNGKFPRLQAEDVPGRDFKTLAKVHKGVRRVVARVNGDFTPEPNSVGALLESMFDQAGAKNQKFKQISASIEAPSNDELDPDMVLNWVDESEGATGLSGISVVFNDKTSLAELDKYREKIQIEVQEVGPGKPAVTEIETSMVQYVNALAFDADASARLIDANGYFLKKS